MRCAADLDAALTPGRLGLVLSIEGMEPLGYDPGLIDVFCALGVRMASLTWNRRNPFADGSAESPLGGLSQIGRALVDRMVALPIAFDLAHANEGTFSELLERTGDRPGAREPRTLPGRLRHAAQPQRRAAAGNRSA